MKIKNPIPVEVRVKQLFIKHLGKDVWEEFVKNKAKFNPTNIQKFDNIYVHSLFDGEEYTMDEYIKYLHKVKKLELLIFNAFPWSRGQKFEWGDIHYKWRDIYKQNEIE